jgi:hypothetical protein
MIDLKELLKPGKLKAHLRDAVTFGPSILLRHVLPRDASGVISISTRLGRLSLRPSDSDMAMLRGIRRKCLRSK